MRRLVLAHVAERASTPGIEHMRADAVRLPGPYIAPLGAIWLAQANGEAIGCVALRPLPDGIGEVKRMYVEAAWRGNGVGRALLQTLIAHARALGYQQLRLGTITEMTAARSLYQSLGFVPIDRYRADEMVDTEFYELELR
ncbi:MAG: GNAT family N-acetyltransferase [Gemmatimonadaceae bacterium]